jgi:hypothetical protein
MVGAVRAIKRKSARHSPMECEREASKTCQRCCGDKVVEINGEYDDCPSCEGAGKVCAHCSASLGGAHRPTCPMLAVMRCEKRRRR